MTYAFVVLIAIASITLKGTRALQPDIRADTNRDGMVDVEGTSDLHDKNSWIDSRGALFLPNIGDTLSRCHTFDRTGASLTNRELAMCNDAAGDSLFAPEYLAPIRILPMPTATENATGSVTVLPREHENRVRLFVKEPDWRYITREYSFNSSQLRSGIELGIDSRQLVTDTRLWDGTVRVQVSVTDGDATDNDEVVFRLAPVLLHHHLQSVEELVVTAPTELDPPQYDFVDELDEVRETIGLQNPLLLINGTSRGFWISDEGAGVVDYNDIGAQDFLEPAYSSIPGADGPIFIRIMLRSPQSTRPAGRQIFEALRGKGVGGFQSEDGLGWEEINSYGNVETTPPYTAPSGKRFPAGRNVLGTVRGHVPIIAGFLRAQRVQDPLFVNMDWTLAGHTDETVSFIPFNNEKGWTVAVPDTSLGLKVLRDAASAGLGSVDAFSKPNISVFFSNDNMTIEQVLADPRFLQTQEYAQKFVMANVAVFQSEIGIPDDEVVRVPSLYFGVEGESDPFYYRSEGLAPRVPPPPPGELHLVAFYPAAVNGVVIGRDFIAPRIWGPVVNGTDIFQEAVLTAYQRAGLTVHFVNTIETIHSQGGEVHCATNTIRDAAHAWWE